MSLIGMLMSRPSSVGTSTTHPVSAFVRNKKNCVKTTYWSNNGQWHSPNELLSSLDRIFWQLGTLWYGLLGVWLISRSNLDGLLTKCEVKMAGYWPSFFVCLWTKEQGQYPAISTEQAWPIKDLLYGFWENLSCRTWWVVQSGQDTGVAPSCPLG